MKKTLLITQMFPPRLGGAENYYFQLCNNFPKDQIVVLADKDLLLSHPGAEQSGAIGSNIPKNSIGLTTGASSQTLQNDNFNFKIYYRDFFFQVDNDSSFLNLKSKILNLIWPKWLKLFFELRKIIEKEKPDVLWAGEVLPAGVVVRLLARFNKLPYFVSTHGADILNPQKLSGWKKLRKIFLMKKIFNDSKFITVNSEYTRLLLSKFGVNRKKSIVVYPCPNITSQKTQNHENTENTRILKQLKKDDYKILLTACRLVPHKGIDTVIKSMPRVWEEFPKTAYVVVGDGLFKKNLEELAKLKDHFVDNRSRIIFTGKVPDNELADIYNLCDIFVMSPREEKGLIEGFGIAYLEAGSFSKPVIGSKIGGVPEAVIDLYDENYETATGLLLDNSRNPNEIAKKILRLLKDRELAKRLGENSKERAKRFMWENEARKVEKIINIFYEKI